MELSDKQLLRYSRQIFLPEIDIVGQNKLINSRVLIIGAGGLGSISAPLLCAAGVGEITIVDDDVVELSNLPRQLAYTEESLGQSKVECLAEKMRGLNSECEVSVVAERLYGEKLVNIIKAHDLVLDGTDNFESRHLHNKASYLAKTPLLTAAVSQFSGQLSFFDYQQGSPCYDCLFPDGQTEQNNCAENGVLGAASSMVASMQALEAIKWLVGMPLTIQHSLLTLDLKTLQWHKAKIGVDPSCSVCL